jgi:hypothetical protein
MTGATIGSIGKFRTIDGASQASMTGTITETANGQYQMALSQADTNGNDVAWLFTYTGAIAVNFNVATTAADPTDSVRFGLTAMPNAAASAVGGLPVAVDTSGRVDVLKINGTSQTARDLGASVLISSGSGAGQLDVTSGVIKSNLAQILGTALTETAGYLAAAFKQFFNIASPTSTLNLLTAVTTLTTYTGNTPQTGDSYARIGAAGAGLTALGDARVANLDAAISTRTKPADTQAAVTTVTNLTNAPTAGDLTATMKTSVTSAATAATPTVTAGTVSDKTGYALSSTAVQAIWDALTSALTTVGSVGKRVADYVDATISSRNATTPPTVMAIRTEMDSNSTKLANLDATVSSRGTYAGADTSGTTTLLGRIPGTVAAQTGDSYARLGAPAGASVSVDIASVKTDSGGLRTDYTTTRAGYLDTLNGIVAAIWAYTTRILTAFAFTPGVSGNLSAGMKTDVENAVWDATTAAHQTTNTTGKALTNAGSAGDPWSTTVPGSYGTGTAGKVLGNLGASVDPWTTPLPGAYSAGSAGSIIGNNLNATITGIPAAVWAVGTRTLSSFGSLVADVATAVWAASTRTLSAFGFSVTASSVTDKTGYSLTVTPPTAIQVRTEMDANSTRLAYLDAAVSSVATAVWVVSVRTLSGFGTLVSDLATAVWTAGTRTLTAFGFTVAATPDTNVALIKAKTDNLPVAPAAVSDIPTAASNADKLLGRNLAGGSDGGRMVKDALRVLRNKVSISGTTMTVCIEDDSGVAWTGVLTVDASAVPITAVDPS